MRDRRYGTMIDKLGEGTRAYDDFTKQMGSQPDFGVPPEEPPVEEPNLWEKIFSPFSPKVQAWRQRQLPVTSDMTTAPQTVGQPPDLRQPQGVPILPPRPREITMSPASPEALRSESGRAISPYGGGAAWSELTPEQQLEVIAKTPKTDPIESAMQNNPILATLRQGSEIASSIVGPGMTGPATALAGMGGKVVKGAKVIKGAEEVAAKGAKAIPKAEAGIKPPAPKLAGQGVEAPLVKEATTDWSRATTGPKVEGQPVGKIIGETKHPRTNEPAYNVQWPDGGVAAVEKKEIGKYNIANPEFQTAAKATTTAEVPPVKPPEPPSGIVPPTVPPKVPAQPSPVSPPPNGIDDALAQAKAIVQRDKPGLLTRIVSRTPGLKQIQGQLHPAVGMKDNILEGWIGQGHTQATVSNALHADLIPTVNTLDTAFGKGASSGTKLAVKFIGSETEKVPFTGTLYDIMQRPQLYDLTVAQRNLLAAIQDTKSGLLNKYRDLYKIEIGEFKTAPGAVHLANVDRAKGAVEAAGSESALLRRGRAKERFYDTGADRYLHDKALAEKGVIKSEDVFQPNLNVGALLDADNEALSTMAGQNVFKTALGGKTKLELIKATHPALYNKMDALKRRLTSLRGTQGRLNEKQQGVIDDFLNSAYSDDELAQFAADLTPQISKGKNVGKDIGDINKEIAGIKAQVEALRPAWRTANPRGNVLVQEGGLYRYFPADEAKTIRRLVEVSKNKWLRYVDEVRATAFGGDLSPATIQGMNAWFADPIGVSRSIGKEMGAAVKERQLLRPFTSEAIASDVKANPESWNRFTMATGLDPLGNYQRAEFGTGFISKIPKMGAKWEAANDALYRGLVKVQKDAFDSVYNTGVKMGLDSNKAAAIAADDVTKLIPHYSYRRLGMSQAEATRNRGLLTSVSFLTQPIAFMNDAAKGIVKLGTFQRLSPSEVYAVKRVMTLAATVSSISAISGAAHASQNGKDPAKAALAAVTPGDPYFWSLVLPNGDRIGLGGPTRSFLNALAPRAVKGYDVPLPFAGLYRWGQGKIHPALQIAIGEIQDKDYFGKQIRTGNFPVNVLQGLEYAVENTVPLTAGTVMEDVRRGTPEKIPTDIISQFGGVNLIPEDKIYNLEREWKPDFKKYNDIPTDSLEIKEKGLESRDQYRKNNPDIDAKLFISGQGESIRSVDAMSEVLKLVRENEIDPMTIDIVSKWDEQVHNRRLDAGFKETLTDELIQILRVQQKGKPAAPVAPAAPVETPKPGTPKKRVTPY